MSLVVSWIRDHRAVGLVVALPVTYAVGFLFPEPISNPMGGSYLDPRLFPLALIATSAITVLASQSQAAVALDVPIAKSHRVLWVIVLLAINAGALLASPVERPVASFSYWMSAAVALPLLIATAAGTQFGLVYVLVVFVAHLTTPAWGNPGPWHLAAYNPPHLVSILLLLIPAGLLVATACWHRPRGRDFLS